MLRHQTIKKHDKLLLSYPKEILLTLIEELAKFYVVNPIFSHIFFVHKYLTKWKVSETTLLL